MQRHDVVRRRWKALVAALALLTSSLVLLVQPATPSAAEDCARRYVAQGDGVPAGEDVASGVEYPQKLLDDHLGKIPGGAGSAPWCLFNTAMDGATTDSFVQGSGSQQSQAWNDKPSLITLELGRQNSRIVDQIDDCYKQIKIYEMFPKAATCAQSILDDTAAWSKLQKDLSGILNAYKTQMAGNPSLVVAVLGYFNPYPSYLKVLPKIPRACLPTVDAAIPCMAWWMGSLPIALQRLDQVVTKLNNTLKPVVQQFTTASQGRFFWVNPYDKFKRHCTQMWVTLALPLVLHPPGVVDSHIGRPVNVGCSPLSSWIADDGTPGVFTPFQYLIPVLPPGIWLAPPLQFTALMGVNPNDRGHGCLSDLVWETVKNKLGVPEKADVNGACARFLDPSDLIDPVVDPGPTGGGEQNPNPSVPPTSAQAQGRVAAGTGHTCAVLTAGSVQCWGKNESGQLGNGTNAGSVDPVTVSAISGATQVAAGDDHTCALVGADGKVSCWGSNVSGQLGNGGTTDSTTPVQVTGLTGVRAIAAGAASTCALLTDGTVKCWGSNFAGQIGDNTSVNRTQPTAVAGITTANPAVAIAAGDHHVCALLTTGAVSCWGANGSGQLGNGRLTDSSGLANVQGLPDPGVNPAVALTAGLGHTCALLKDNSARCWGANESGQLGFDTPDADGDGSPDPSGPGTVRDGSTEPHTLFGLTALAAGSSHTCGRMTDGSVRCWGGNYAGQLGRDPEQTPGGPSAVVVPGLNGATSLPAGSFHSCAVVGTGVKCWGSNGDGQLGLRVPSSPTPVIVGGTAGATAVTVGTGFACALVDADLGNSLPAGTTNKAVCWGDNSHGQVGAGAPAGDSAVQAVTGIASADAIDAGNGQACAVVTTSLSCWGRNTDGEVGNGSTSDQFAPAPVPGAVSPAISAGGGRDAAERGHTCAVRPDGTVGCWGRNADSQLGDGTTTDRSSPVTVQIDTDPAPGPDHVALADLTGVRKVVTGGFHSCALTTDRTVWCWGRNDHGQLGDNTAESRSVATQVRTNADPTQDHPLGNVVGLAAGADFTCAVLDGGGVSCWGASGRGQLGIGFTFGIDVRLPSSVQGLPAPATSITAGDTHVCAALADDSLVCWGGNTSGQLGDGSYADRLSPTVIMPAPPAVAPPAQPAEGPVIRSISASRANTCVTRFDKRVACWGDNGHGQLGTSGGGVSAAPVAVQLAGPV